MSPEMAKHFANHPIIQKLLKAVPNKSEVLTELKREYETKSSPGLEAKGDPCFNCGTTVSSSWLAKKAKDGTVQRVCQGEVTVPRTELSLPRRVRAVLQQVQADAPERALGHGRRQISLEARHTLWRSVLTPSPSVHERSLQR